MFNNCENLEEADVSLWDTSSVKDMYKCFYNCKSLKVLDLRRWDMSEVTRFGDAIDNCTSLTSLTGGSESLEESALNGLKVSIRLNNSTLLDRPSLRAVINGLADLTDTESQTLTLGATLRAKLEPEDIAIATGKNWVIA